MYKLCVVWFLFLKMIWMEGSTFGIFGAIMKQKLFLDTNIIIDYIGRRVHFLSAATLMGRGIMVKWICI